MHQQLAEGLVVEVPAQQFGQEVGQRLHCSWIAPMIGESDRKSREYIRMNDGQTWRLWRDELGNDGRNDVNVDYLLIG